MKLTFAANVSEAPEPVVSPRPTNWNYRPEADLRSTAALAGSLGRYSITLSARTRIAGGIVMPIAFAVLRLITNSYLVG